MQADWLLQEIEGWYYLLASELGRAKHMKVKETRVRPRGLAAPQPPRGGKRATSCVTLGSAAAPSLPPLQPGRAQRGSRADMYGQAGNAGQATEQLHFVSIGSFFKTL